MHLRNFLKSRFHPNYCVALKISCLYINIYSAAKFLSRLVFGRTINFQKLLYAHSIVYNSDLESGEQSFLLAGAPSTSTWAAGVIRQFKSQANRAFNTYGLGCCKHASIPKLLPAKNSPANSIQLSGQTRLFNAYPRSHGAGERHFFQVHPLGGRWLGFVQRINQCQQILAQCFRRE